MEPYIILALRLVGKLTRRAGAKKDGAFCLGSAPRLGRVAGAEAGRPQTTQFAALQGVAVHGHPDLGTTGFDVSLCLPPACAREICLLFFFFTSL
jgi:hypothetical protein